MKRFFSLLLSAALLAALCACTAPAGQGAASPAPSDSSAPAPSASDSWSQGLSDDLTAGADYGAIVPYIGGTIQLADPYLTPGETADSDIQYLYGLSTADGRLLTAPVYHAVYGAAWYDYSDQVSRSLPIYFLVQPATDGKGNSYNAVGLAAADGSWYTGLRYQAGLSVACRDSQLMMLDADTAVLVSLSDGQELARYCADDFLAEDEADLAPRFISDSLCWGVRAWGGYLCYDPQLGGTSGRQVWIDGATGRILDEAPVEAPEFNYGDGRRTFQGGWYYPDDDPLVFHYTDGTEETVRLPDGLGDLAEASRQYLLFSGVGGNTLTDHAGTVLATGNLWFFTDQLTGQSYPYSMDYDADSNSTCTFLDGAGSPLFTARVWTVPAGGLVSVVDDAYYRLVDLKNGGRDLLCLSREDGPSPTSGS